MRDLGGLNGAIGKDLLLVILLSAVIFGYAHFQAFANPFVINDDVRQQIFWMQQWQDPELFKGDVLSDYARHYVTWGVKGVYRLAALGLNPVDFSRVLPGILFVFLAGCLFKIGDVLGDRPLAWMAVAVFWLMPFFLDNLCRGTGPGLCRPAAGFFLALLAPGKTPGGWGWRCCCRPCSSLISFCWPRGGYDGLFGRPHRPR